MDTLTLDELKDLYNTLIWDTRGTHGDARSVRLDALHIKLGKIIKQKEAN